MRILIYSAEFGDYETELRQPIPPSMRQGVMYNYHRFDEKYSTIRFGLWHHREPLATSKEFCLKPQFRARFHKIDPLGLLHDEQTADFTIWVDASMTLLADPFDLVQLLGDADLMTFMHRHRTTVEEEGEAVIKIKGQNPDTIRKQIAFQKQAGYDNYIPLPETGLLIRRVCKRVRRFNEIWWNQIKIFSVRDQMGFGFSAWKSGIKIKFFPGHVRSQKYNLLGHHRSSTCRTQQ